MLTWCTHNDIFFSFIFYYLFNEQFNCFLFVLDVISFPSYAMSTRRQSVVVIWWFDKYTKQNKVENNEIQISILCSFALEFLCLFRAHFQSLERTQFLLFFEKSTVKWNEETETWKCKAIIMFAVKWNKFIECD